MTRKERTLERQDTLPSETERAAKYADLIWKSTFRQHGIGDKYHDKWFFNYICVGDEQKSNLDVIKKYCRRNTSIALLGDVGNGKTHLACAILKDSIVCGGKDHHSISSGHYYTFSDLHRQYRESQSDPEKSEAKFMNEICTMKCLVIDEIQIKSDSDSEQRMFQEIIDKRYANNRQTVYVGNTSFEGFKKILGERLVDRLVENGIQLIIFKGESYRNKAKDLEEI